MASAICKIELVDVAEWRADGVWIGIGTRVEFDHWKDEGVVPDEATFGPVVGREPASNDADRKSLWEQC